MDFILCLKDFPPEITSVNKTVLWRGSQRDICTTFFQTFLKQYLPDIIKRGGLSAALCFAIFRSYPEASVSNFRQLTNSQLIFTVEQEGRFTEDVSNGIAQLNLKKFFNSLGAMYHYQDRYFNIYKNLPVEICRHIVHEEKAANDDGILQSSIPSTEKEKDKILDKSDHETSTTEEATLNLDDFMVFFAAEDNELLWKQKKYKDAVPGLEKELKTASSFDRSIVQIKLALCLKESGQTDASNQMLGEALNSLEKS
uniref:Uncharacterized protein n=1 Tax=Ciona savignyi TaxID=51511 RepID=H2YVK0_CIOSA